MTIVNGNSRVVTKFETLLNDDARVVIYNCHRFIIQASGASSLIQTLDLKIRHLKCFWATTLRGSFFKGNGTTHLYEVEK